MRTPETAESTEHEPCEHEPRYLVTDAGMDALRDAHIVPDGERGEQPDAFTPDTADKVDWVLGRIADARARAARLRENMELMAREAEREAAFFEWKYGPALQAFARAQTEGTRRKSLRLPNGVLGYRTRPAGVSVTDDAAALAWAKSHLPAAVAERLDRKALADALLASGEVVGFAALMPAEEIFFIK
jgi:phage host-nuclease inhibitor protein Gam